MTPIATAMAAPLATSRAASPLSLSTRPKSPRRSATGIDLEASVTFVRDMRRPRVDTRTGASLLVYYRAARCSRVLEQVGKTTNDTKTPLIERPVAFLQGATTLWDPQHQLR